MTSSLQTWRTTEIVSTSTYTLWYVTYRGKVLLLN
jgi:hypothetical protein